jgi:Domain of unknown function (DUF4399)
MNSYRLLGRVALLAAAAITVPAIAPAETAAPPNAAVYIISPKDGDTVASPFKVQFGLSGMGIAPAGVEKANTGHHHLIIDATLAAEELKAPIVVEARPFRRRPDRGHGDAGAGPAYAAACARRLDAYPVQSAAHVARRHGHGEVTRALER